MKTRSYLLAVNSFFRQKTSLVFNSYLKKNEAGLLLGIVFGIKEGMGRDFYQKLKSTGVLHVVAASGTNVSMVSGFLLGLGALFLKRKTAVIFTLTGILFYALISGLDPSIVRASLMAGVSYAALLLGRQNTSYIALFITAFIMLFINPEILRDIGFQLSFSSTFGILSVKPIIDRFLRGKNFLFQDLSTTFSAQIGSVPFMIGAFSSYSLFSLFVNALVLWTIPFLMILGGIASIAGIILPSVSAPFLYLSYPLLLFFEKVVDIFSGAEQVNFDNLPTTIYIGYYFILFSIIWYFKGERS